MSFSPDMQAAIDELDRCDVSTLLHHLLPEMQAAKQDRLALQQQMQALEQKMQTILEQQAVLLERSAPKSSCIFCTPRLPKTVTATTQRDAFVTRIQYLKRHKPLDWDYAFSA